MQGWRGSGSLNLTDAVLGQVPISQGWLRFVLRERGLDIQRLSLVSPEGKVDLKGQAVWEAPAEGHALGKLTYRGDGRIASLNEGMVWSAPCRFKGTVRPSDAWKGDLEISAPTIQIRHKETEPFEAQLRWDRESLSWESLRWGRSLVSNGSIRFGTPAANVSGLLNVQDFDLTRWQGLIWPQVKEPVKGSYSGIFNLSGTTQDPVLQFSGKLRKAVCREV